MKGFSNQIKIEAMVSYYFSSYISEQLKNIKSGTGTHAHTHTHARTHAHTHTHTHTHTHVHTCIPTTWTKAMLRKKGVHWPSKPVWFENASIHKKYV